MSALGEDYLRRRLPKRAVIPCQNVTEARASTYGLSNLLHSLLYVSFGRDAHMLTPSSSLRP